MLPQACYLAPLTLTHMTHTPERKITKIIPESRLAVKFTLALVFWAASSPGRRQMPAGMRSHYADLLNVGRWHGAVDGLATDAAMSAEAAGLTMQVGMPCSKFTSSLRLSRVGREASTSPHRLQCGALVCKTHNVCAACLELEQDQASLAPRIKGLGGEPR